MLVVDRDAIERRDFPIGRRGYEQAAVDAHLRRVADALEALHKRAPLAAGASEQVRVILEAAEAGAAELRADAGREASAHVERVQEAAAGMLARIDEVERELGTLLEALRRSGERLTAGLAELHDQVGSLDGAREPVPTPPDEEDFAGAAPAVADEAAPPAADEAAPVAGDDTAGPHDEPAAAPAGEPAPSKPAVNGDDAGARLIALNMALDGKPREETARFLAEQFGLADAEALLDDVYARAGQ
jgi:DivIVA domain-containing protein